MTSQPLVSVVIPAFNAAATLGETLGSVESSTYRNIEVLVVDDGSTDDTAAVAADFQRRDPRFCLHRQSNGGLARALNAGFERAEGDYVARLDADDVWHPTKLERQMEVASRIPEAGFIYTFVRYIDEASQVLRDGPEQRFPPWALCRGVVESLAGGGSTALMKRSAMIEAGRCDPAFPAWEDLVMQLQISSRHPIAFVPEYLAGYRVREGSMSAATPAMLAAWRPLRQMLRRQFPDIPGKVLRWAHGARCTLFAEQQAWRGNYGRSAALLAEGIATDPVWTSIFLAHRLARRLIGGSRSKAFAGPPFLDCAPAERLRPAFAPAGALGRLKAERDRELETIDRRITSEQLR
jgi:glycosyltransferase involved in cell wall biosynthesis